MSGTNLRAKLLVAAWKSLMSSATGFTCTLLRVFRVFGVEGLRVEGLRVEGLGDLGFRGDLAHRNVGSKHSSHRLSSHAALWPSDFLHLSCQGKLRLLNLLASMLRQQIQQLCCEN